MGVRQVGRVVKRVARTPLKVARYIKKNPKKSAAAAYVAALAGGHYVGKRIINHVVKGGGKKIKWF